ncbi:sensor histidine kinase [Blautia sp. XA-2221]|uniref:sensor histidine kinase n=1 Tax=Blautia sp. XA-2221 TaxID=2903961 RepID=UPI0023793EF8|nr:HAMP domain-containing sensor histidine kinase [Blautia sp. XA-2221]
MFRKLHIHMTLFSTFITGTILVLLASACLVITESNIRQKHYTVFTNNAYSCVSHLESQNVLSHRWIQQVETNYNIDMQIYDGNTPLFFEQLHSKDDMKKIFEQAKKESAKNHGLNLDSPQSSQALSKIAMFQLPGYYACTARIPKNGGILNTIILYPLDAQSKQIRTIRFVFFAAVIAAISALAVFSWFFTRKMIRPLEKNRKEQNAFIAAASHELRSPLTVIQTSLSAISYAEPEQTEHFISISLDECKRMSRLIQDMLSLSRSDNHTWILDCTSCEMDTLLLDVYEKYEQTARQKKKQLLIELPEDSLPVCFCDSLKISQALAILIDNALTYVPEGGVIRLSARQETSSVALFVSDNGPGIPDSEKDSVFQRFYRSDTSRNDKQHFGLGLCIAKEIALLHHGTLTILDTPGGGATFKLKLPLN